MQKKMDEAKAVWEKSKADGDSSEKQDKLFDAYMAASEEFRRMLTKATRAGAREMKYLDTRQKTMIVFRFSNKSEWDRLAEPLAKKKRVGAIIEGILDPGEEIKDPARLWHCHLISTFEY